MLSIIGKSIQQLREENNLTIGELAERTGIKAEKLEQIEANKVIPSLGMLIKISRSLGSRLGTLLDGRENIGAVVTRSSDVNQGPGMGSSETGDNSHLQFYSLASGKSGRHMEPFFIKVEPCEPQQPSKSEHEGEEFIYVLKGEVDFHYGGEKHTLKTGDSIYYDSLVPHFMANETSQTAEILAVIYTPY